MYSTVGDLSTYLPSICTSDAWALYLLLAAFK